MNIENQVCSLELSKRLKELGCKQESLWWWILKNYSSGTSPSFLLVAKSEWAKVIEDQTERCISAFTVSELIALCQENQIDLNADMDFNIWKKQEIPNQLAKMLVYLIENKLLTPKE